MAKTNLKLNTRTHNITPTAIWKNLRQDWLISVEPNALTPTSQSDAWFNQVAARRTQLENYSAKLPRLRHFKPKVLIAEADPTQFLAGFWAALLAGWDIALANPHWGHQEWSRASYLIQPTVVWASSSPLAQISTQSIQTLEKCTHTPLPSLSTDESLILIPTGGSSGQVKFACHHWQTLTIAAIGFCNYFGSGKPISSYCVLPLYHVSGLMQAIRTLVSGGQLLLASLNDIEIATNSLRSKSAFISLVPTQLERLLRADQAKQLRQFEGVLLGGAPSWRSLLNRAASNRIPVCLSYGMTETAAMVTVTDADAFLEANGQMSTSGQTMSHADIQIEKDGEQLPVGEVGQVVVRSPAVARGYYSASSPAFGQNTFYTDDLGYLDVDGHLHISGRISHKIISGGENIFPDEVEAALRATHQVSDVYVLGLPDKEWGEVVAAAYVPTDESVSPASLKHALSSASDSPSEFVPDLALKEVSRLSHYKHPKRWLALGTLPRNAQGKINRAALLNLF